MDSVTDIWNLVLEALSKQLTPTALKTWFDDCVPSELEDQCLIICTKSEFKRNIIVQRFSEVIKSTLSDLFSCPFDVLVLTDDELLTRNEKKINEDDKNLPPEMAGYTFDHFVVGSSNKLAHARSIAVAQNPGNKLYNPLFIYGNSGLGKTHLLFSIGQYIHNNNPKAKIIYVKGDEFTNEMVASIRDGTQENFRNKYRGADLFLMDDVQFIAGKQQTQIEFFHTFNSIYEAGHQIVITSDRPPMEMATLEDRLRTRFEGGCMADIQPPDIETRIAIIRNKAAQLGLIIPDDVVEYIAKKVTSNVRQLEGIIKSLSGYRDIGNDLNIEIAKKAIEVVIREGEYIPNPDDIIKETARCFQLTPDEIKGQSKSKNVANARHISIYLIRTLTNLSLQDIGENFGGRNHSTVLSSIRKVEELIKSDNEVAAIIRDITSNVNSRA